MFAKIFFAIIRNPWGRRIVWKKFYQTLASKIPVENWHFMNYGYSKMAEEETLILPEKEELHRYPLQMYHFLAVKTDLKGKDVLEVSSGRGGGSRYIAQYLGPKTMTGLDIADKAVAFANTQHKSENLKYVAGNAEKLPFAANSFDAIINVESCHTYGSVPRFLNEVKRVLRPGGLLLLVDIRDKAGMDLLNQEFLQSGLEKLEEEDISSNVVGAIRAESDVKVKRIKEFVPPKYQGMFSEFAGVAGSGVHRQLETGALVYHRFVLRKN